MSRDQIMQDDQHNETGPDLGSRIKQAEIRTELADTWTEQAESRTELAKTRTEQAETRMEHAESRTELAETAGRNIAWEIHPLPTERADRELLRLVLVNLLGNAIKFTGHRAAAKIEIGSVPSAVGETVIFIRDNGAGFDPQYAGKLFGVFQRLHSQDKFVGTGIGLANVQRIIQRHGGRVWAEGAVNSGATFYFSLPNASGDSHPAT